MRTVLLVPYRPDGGHRDRLWAWVSDRWSDEHPDISIFTHSGLPEGPFNRSAAVNGASDFADALGGWDLALIADSDSFVAPEQIEKALAMAQETGQLVIAHDHWRRLSKRGSERIMAGYSGSWEPFVEFDLPLTVSSMLACPRALWEEMRGFDPGFVGWGAEDLAFHAAAHWLGGGTGRIPGPVWHLWHPKPDASGTPEYHANFERMHHYTDCGDRAEMLALIKELRG